ncbi:carotenoid biosynthesis protein [Spongisporangium articulatum]|uniref:Carotenoid biosynthesis protein n=1 Tax=Spongisporangium articulatum TaxID=3362603 RepID=A0ABW8ASR2_9ACTN
MTSAALAVAGVVAQIAYPLLSGPALTAATVAGVVLFAAAGLAHATSVAGLTRAAAVFALAWVATGLVEAVGVTSGLPFGAYEYAGDGRLGPQLLGVPVLVPVAWSMLAYPALLLARRLGTGRAARALLGGGTLTGWDLFLDPQMVAAGHWRWLSISGGAHGLPGVADVPVTNYLGWFAVGSALTLALDAVLPENPSATGDLAPALVLGWTWLGSTVGNLTFFDRPAVAAYGFVGLGLFVLPYLRSLTPGPQARALAEVTR